MKRVWLSALMAAALGLTCTIMLVLLLGQLCFAGPIEPLAALAQPSVRQAMTLSVVCATLAAALAVLVATPTAYALVRWRFPFNGIVDALVDVPILLSPVALGVSLLLVFRSAPGQWFELHVARVVFEPLGILIAQFVLALALSVRVLKATFEEIDPRMEQVARCLGCTPWGAFRRVTLPLSRPGLSAAFVLSWARAIGDFGATVTLGGAVQGHTETMPVSIYLSMASMDLNRAVGLMIVLTLVALAVLLFARRATRRRTA